MCFSGGNDDAQNAAHNQEEMTRLRQEQHEGAVNQGKAKIDESFAQFDDPYYQHYTDAYKGAYNPQLDDQYSKARDKLTAILAGRGTLESSVGANSVAQLGKTYNDAQADIGNKAADATNAFKAKVDTTKGNLYQTNAAAADPLSAATMAQSSAGTLVAPQSYGNLGNVFGDALGAFSTANKANSQSMNPWPWNQQGGNAGAPSGMGSAIYG